jgi:sporulation protein YlmC with PRC-barrel domain
MKKQTSTIKKPDVLRTATSVTGEKVQNHAGEHLGDIRDIMLNISDGKIRYFVIEFGGFLGIGEKYFAIPFRLLEYDRKKEIFILNQKRETLEKAPGFDKDHWPDTYNHSEQVDFYWGDFMGVNVGSEY